MKNSKLAARFFRTARGNEPVREWLKSLPSEERKIIGVDIADVQYAWPVGMPLVRNLGDGIWEVRSNLGDRIARVLFILQENQMILLHGFIKKTGKTPQSDIELAKRRAKALRR